MENYITNEIRRRFRYATTVLNRLMMNFTVAVITNAAYAVDSDDADAADYEFIHKDDYSDDLVSRCQQNYTVLSDTVDVKKMTL